MIRPADLTAVQSDLDDAAAAISVAARRANSGNVDYISRDLQRAVDAQQRALVAMLGMLERESRISAAQRGRVSGLEAWVS